MNGRTLVVATWGHPAQWHNVLYSVGTKVRDFKCCTSLIPLLKYLEGKEVDVAIVALDSLAEKPRKSVDSPCYICYESLSKELENPLKDGYRELREALEAFLRKFFQCLTETYGSAMDVNLKRVVIGPALGSPGGNWRFEGSAMDFEALVLGELGRLCLRERYSRLILDLTHGVNYVPSIVTRLASKLASVLLVAHEDLREVRLTIYNSDPAVQDGKANINVIADEVVKHVQPLHKLPPPVELEGSTDVLGSSLKGWYYGFVKYVVSSLYYPLPLALHELALQSYCVSPEDPIEEILSLWTSHVEVDYQSLRVRRRLSLCPDSIYAILLTKAVCRRLSPYRGPLDVEKAKGLARVYESVHRALYELINHELSLLEKGLKEGKIPARQSTESKERKADKRIMIAHAGLQEGLVEVDPSGKMGYVKDVRIILNKEAKLVLDTSKKCGE